VTAQAAGNDKCKSGVGFGAGVEHGGIAARFPRDRAEDFHRGGWPLHAGQALNPLRAGRAVRTTLAAFAARAFGAYGAGCAPEVFTAISRFGKIRAATGIKKMILHLNSSPNM